MSHSHTDSSPAVGENEGLGEGECLLEEERNIPLEGTYSLVDKYLSSCAKDTYPVGGGMMIAEGPCIAEFTGTKEECVILQILIDHNSHHPSICHAGWV